MAVGLMSEDYKEYKVLYDQLKINPRISILRDNMDGILIKEIDFLVQSDIDLIRKMNLIHSNNPLLPIVEIQISVR